MARAGEAVETKKAAIFRVYQDNARKFTQRRADEEPSAAARGTLVFWSNLGTVAWSASVSRCMICFWKSLVLYST